MKILYHCSHLIKPTLAIFAFLTALSSVSTAAEMCKKAELLKERADHPLCYFYTGTESFRKQNYADASEKWQLLLELKEVPLEYEHLRTSAYNNLGYLYFMGQGVTKDQKRAFKYWTHASTLGHEEAAYHLCHAYADMKDFNFDSRKALGYCKEALRRFNLLKPEELKDSEEIIKQLKKYVSQLGGLALRYRLSALLESDGAG